jgi:chaperonin GroES
MEKFPVEPLFDRVFVKKDDASKDEDGILHLPDSIKGRAKTGTVVAVGPGYFNTTTGKFIPTSVKVGDRVYLKEFDGYRVDINGEQVFIFQENEIIGKLVV